MKTEEKRTIPQGEFLNQHDEKISLQNYLKKSFLIIFFYPKDMTSGCTLEVQNFRDSAEELNEIEASVIGV